MKKILKKLIRLVKPILLEKLYEYKNRRRYGSKYDADLYEKELYEETHYKPKYLKRKKKKDFKYRLKKILD